MKLLTTVTEFNALAKAMQVTNAGRMAIAAIEGELTVYQRDKLRSLGELFAEQHNALSRLVRFEPGDTVHVLREYRDKNLNAFALVSGGSHSGDGVPHDYSVNNTERSKRFIVPAVAVRIPLHKLPEDWSFPI